MNPTEENSEQLDLSPERLARMIAKIDEKTIRSFEKPHQQVIQHALGIIKNRDKSRKHFTDQDSQVFRDALLVINIESEKSDSKIKKILISTGVIISLLITLGVTRNKNKIYPQKDNNTPRSKPKDKELPPLPRSQQTPTAIRKTKFEPLEKAPQGTISTRQVRDREGRMIRIEISELVGQKRKFIVKREINSNFATFIITHENNRVILKRYMTTTMAQFGASYTVFYKTNKTQYPSNRVQEILQKTGDKWAAVELTLVEILNEGLKVH